MEYFGEGNYMKKVLSASLYFLFFCSLFINIRCIDDIPCALARLSDEQIAKHYEHVVSEFKKSNKIHKGVQIGTYAIGAAAIILTCYELLAPNKTVSIPRDLKSYSPEQLTELVTNIQGRLELLERGPHLFSWAYVKSLCYSLIWSPITILRASSIFLKFSDHYLNHVLYCANLSSFLGDKTKLGLLSKKEIPTTVDFEFELGQLPKDVEQCASALDGASASLLPIDVPFQRRNLIECCNQIVNELSSLLAFIKYVDSLSTNQKNHFENAECARYLINCVNNFSEGIEARLNETSNEKLLPLVTAFNTELQAVMIRFAHALA